MLNASSRVTQDERDRQKYEKARKLHRFIDKIRENYQTDWKNKEMRIHQRVVALYFICKLPRHVGKEKYEDETDTVDCCSLRVEHIKLFEKINTIGENVVEFDFLGKDWYQKPGVYFAIKRDHSRLSWIKRFFLIWILLNQYIYERSSLGREENKDIALGTSKLNYLDPRISVAWRKKWDVPIEEIYSKTQHDKLLWAVDMATADYHFYNYEGEIVLHNVDDEGQQRDSDDE
ncbi:unnamed protein product [Rotaria socialis]|uniref:DNA topoisomerase n=1 Tax=Rotaria socialis TaxID=392032 RepID=A0A820KYQ0_9BILA|nr:unnamed protein product [Rotaria socialis]CAF4344524.1 unnamed protein product [Rotaria socialis]CAF4390987.1 unnamed protein product [Rotaria socialis]